MTQRDTGRQPSTVPGATKIAGKPPGARKSQGRDPPTGFRGSVALKISPELCDNAFLFEGTSFGVFCHLSPQKLTQTSSIRIWALHTPGRETEHLGEKQGGLQQRILTSSARSVLCQARSPGLRDTPSAQDTTPGPLSFQMPPPVHRASA